MLTHVIGAGLRKADDAVNGTDIGDTSLCGNDHRRKRSRDAPRAVNVYGHHDIKLFDLRVNNIANGYDTSIVHQPLQAQVTALDNSANGLAVVRLGYVQPDRPDVLDTSKRLQ